MNSNINNEHAHDHLFPCSDCGEMVPEQYLSLNLETEAFARTILDDIHHGTEPDMTNVDPKIVLCPNCRAQREQAKNRNNEEIKIAVPKQGTETITEESNITGKKQGGTIMNTNTNNEHAHDHLLPCSDCGAMVPAQDLSLNLETEAFVRTIFGNIHRDTKPDMTNVDPQIVLCPNCRALREQAMNR